MKIPEISDLDFAFPSDALEWMPKKEDIPEQFWRGSTEWNKIVSTWFFRGLPGTSDFIPKDGVDAKKALRAVKATMGSFAPKHEHKEAACAYMLSEWFERVEGWEAALGIK